MTVARVVDLDHAADEPRAGSPTAFLSVTLPVLIDDSIRAIITPDLAAVSIRLIDRVVGLELFLRSR
jgi:hypothetical protein